MYWWWGRNMFSKGCWSTSSSSAYTSMYGWCTKILNNRCMTKRPRQKASVEAVWSGSSLFAILTSTLWISAPITNILVENRKRKPLKILEHLPHWSNGKTDTIICCIWALPKCVLWQTVKTQIKILHNVAFHQGLHCLLWHKQSTEKEKQFYCRLSLVNPQYIQRTIPSLLSQIRKKNPLVRIGLMPFPELGNGFRYFGAL